MGNVTLSLTSFDWALPLILFDLPTGAMLNIAIGFARTFRLTQEDMADYYKTYQSQGGKMTKLSGISCALVIPDLAKVRQLFHGQDVERGTYVDPIQGGNAAVEV